jgi:hypothetical protein
MEFVFKSIFIASFVLVAVFGFTIMMSGSAHCLVSVMQGGVCPEGLFGFASFHIGFFKNLSSVASGNLGLLAVSLILAVILALAAGFQGETSPVNLSSFAVEKTEESTRLKKKLRSWLSLLETSPTLVVSR